MKLSYRGTGTVLIEGVGDVRSGETIEVPDAIGQALHRQDPATWAAADWDRARAVKARSRKES